MHKHEIRSLICSMLLGDGYINIHNTPNHTGGDFRIDHSFSQEDYALWKAQLIDKIFKDKKLGRRCKIYRRSRLDKRTNKIYHTVTVCLSWKSYMNYLRQRVYSQSKKKNIKWLLTQINSDKHLAIWFMDDATESKTKAKHRDGSIYHKNPYFRLATYCFTYGQCQLIKEWFKRNYKVNPSINQYKHGPILQFTVADSKKLFPHIRPYINQFESMRKKFKICLERY